MNRILTHFNSFAEREGLLRDPRGGVLAKELKSLCRYRVSGLLNFSPETSSKLEFRAKI